MKKIVLGSLLVASSLMMTSCVITPDYIGFAVAPAPVAVVSPEIEIVPESYVWDGFEYVGIVGGEYVYLGSTGVWCHCEPWRLDRFHGWERGHADWRSHPEHFGGSKHPQGHSERPVRR